MFRTLTNTRLLVSAFIVLMSAASAAALKPEAEHALTNRAVVHNLYQHHYSRKYLNDEFSAKAYDQYLTSLDHTRSYFTQDDVNEFQQYKTKLDDAIKTNDLAPAFAMYNRYRDRAIERLEFAVGLLKKDDGFDFDKDETLDLDRENAPWAQSTGELDDLWRKRIKNTILNLKLAGKEKDEITDLLTRRYESQLNRIKQLNAEDGFQTYMNAVTHIFDPHTQYMSPRNSENFNINMSLSLQGIGAVLSTENENTIVQRLVTGGPADKAGELKPSDKIVGVGQDGEPMTDVIGWRLDEVVELIRGPKGSKVRLEIITGSGQTEKHKIITIVRDEVKLEDRAAQKEIIEIEQDGKKHKLGVVDIPAFYADFEAKNANDPNYRSTTRDVSKLIEELKEEGIDGLIVDLRNNGGGSLSEVNDLVGLFIPQGPTVQIRNTRGATHVMNDNNPGTLYDGPLLVMTNRLSASASEIFAGAIQDYGRGLVVGSQTFGKGTVQTLIPLFRGQLKITNAKFYRINGESTQHRGVLPDIEFPEIYDVEKIGESALEEALPWDQIKPSKYAKQKDLSKVIGKLADRHTKRVKDNPDFIYLNKQSEFLKELRNDTIVSLNIQTREKERNKTKEKRLQLENERRLAKGMEPLDDIDEDEAGPSSEQETENEESSEDGEQTADTDEEETTADALLEEGGHILVDYIKLVS
ncbi:carboxy terminal-processing peptidase [Bermanella sp. R86510]|uniref:carboxy terminal-processing peptidase n=1 Tax=unclassified Bermanella TaxID=2627862 RepID=UPI0037C76BB8